MNPILSVAEGHSELLASRAECTLTEALTHDVIAELMADQLAQAGWYHGEGLGLEPEQLQALQAEVRTLHRSGQLAPAAVGRGHGKMLDSSIRSDRTAWLDGQSQAQAALFQRFSQLQQHLNRSLYLGLTHFEAHFAAFEPGAFYRPHRDSFRGRASRVVSLVLYLNDNWDAKDGGELRIYASDGSVAADILPNSGHAACFLSEDILHEVCPAQRLRYSIACWFRADVSENLAFIR